MGTLEACGAEPCGRIKKSFLIPPLGTKMYLCTKFQVSTYYSFCCALIMSQSVSQDKDKYIIDSSLCNDCIQNSFKPRGRCKLEHERSECSKYLSSGLKAEYNRYIHYFIYDQIYCMHSIINGCAFHSLIYIFEVRMNKLKKHDFNSNNQLI